MATDIPSKISGAGLSLYANLLEPSGSSSKTPVVSHQVIGDSQQLNEASASRQQISAASLRFQPTKRPQVSTLKPKSKPALQKTSHVSTLTGGSLETDRPGLPNFVNHLVRGKNTLANWTTDAEDRETADTYPTEKRQRGGRKNRKKNRDGSPVPQNWEDIYDPSRPNNYEEYKNSHERHMGTSDWKVRLYKHRLLRNRSGDADMFETPSQQNTSETVVLSVTSARNIDEISAATHITQDGHTVDDCSINTLRARSLPNSKDQNVVLSASDDDASKRDTSPSRPTSLASECLPQTLPSVISKGPVLYEHISAPLPKLEARNEDFPPEYEDVDENARSLRPGQKGFAERLMSKYGWTKGTGLGASGSGIVDPLRVQLEKQKKKPDAEGGGFVRSGGTGKIIGGTKHGRSSFVETGKFGQASEVIVIHGITNETDMNDGHTGAGDGGLSQQIGDECSQKYGRVERVLIDRSSLDMTPIYLKFTSQLSALRAVNALDGSTFNGNKIAAKFYELERFENGVLDLS